MAFVVGQLTFSLNDNRRPLWLWALPVGGNRCTIPVLAAVRNIHHTDCRSSSRDQGSSVHDSTGVVPLILVTGCTARCLSGSLRRQMSAAH